MAKKLSEQRARQVARELMGFRGWDLNPVSSAGQLLEESEYKNYSAISKIFKGESKTGSGDGRPDFLLVNSHESLKPILIIETKAALNQSAEANDDAIHYGEACLKCGHEVLVVGVAGADREICSVTVKRKVSSRWVDLTVNGKSVDWIPSPAQTQVILGTKNLTEIQPEKPGEDVLNAQANKLNEILRECKIKDEYRPVYAATFMLALWQGDVSVDPDVVLKQINANAQLALSKAGKRELSDSLRVDVENETLAAKAWEIIDILKKLNIRSLVHEHDYLGQLYETFFRYTGGNTIGQYFTPRHIIEFICDVLDMSETDSILDPACGTGGFLIGALNQVANKKNLPYEDVVDIVKNNLFGIESEPSTAALCITNMIFRGDGKSGIIKANCFTKANYPNREMDFVLMNPPFPHKKTDTPATDFIDRGLKSLKKRGMLASIVPYSLLVRMSDWHKKILSANTITFIATLPPDLFNPYASYNTAILMIQKGVPHEDKKTFVCRIFNDGYKLKKGYRVSQAGSQLLEILSACEAKRAIPGLCAMAPIAKGSLEWSPEAYIANAKYTPEEFISGFEESIRKQASFYVMYGVKILKDFKGAATLSLGETIYSAKSSVSLQGIKLGHIQIDKYFDIELGGGDEIEDLEDGDDPIVSTSEFMNGVTTWKKASSSYSAPCITVATDGSTCSSFVQEFPFYAFYKVAILTPKKDAGIPVDALYYIAHVINRERWRYVYARKFGKQRISSTNLLVPVAADGRPDFKKMASLANQVNSFRLIKVFRDAYFKANKQKSK